jgi:hypothetical protein
MAKRTYSRQAFLNPASSEDSGNYKFSLQKKDEIPGRVTVIYRIADCSQHIELDFSVWGIRDPDDPEKVTPAKIKSTIDFLEERRAKMRKWAKAVAEFAEKYDDALALAKDDLTELL